MCSLFCLFPDILAESWRINLAVQLPCACLVRVNKREAALTPHNLVPTVNFSTLHSHTSREKRGLCVAAMLPNTPTHLPHHPTHFEVSKLRVMHRQPRSRLGKIILHFTPCARLTINYMLLLPLLVLLLSGLCTPQVMVCCEYGNWCHLHRHQKCTVRINQQTLFVSSFSDSLSAVPYFCY